MTAGGPGDGRGEAMGAGDGAADAVPPAGSAPVPQGTGVPVGGAPAPPVIDIGPADGGTAAVPVGSQLVVRSESAPAFPRGDGSLEPRPSAPARRNARVSKPARQPQWLVNQLPVGMLNSDFFVRFVSLFQELSETLLDGADQIENIPDATVTPVPMLGHLASWIGVETVDASLPEDLQRLILRSSSRALAFRGTRRGLTGYLEMLSGGPVEVTDGGGVWIEGEAPDDVGWVRMSVDGTGHLSEDEFVALVRDEIPAHVRAELYIRGRRALCTEEDRR
jgi:phage tail-like protein